ncbi:hypothetical protein K438DRAFT_1770757 [Mycena galopus ATCC 62051]|nr:hypothetical protein K438DRAFT_1770757 [Mycena galopus ATCC 62051]
MSKTGLCSSYGSFPLVLSFSPRCKLIMKAPLKSAACSSFPHFGLAAFVVPAHAQMQHTGLHVSPPWSEPVQNSNPFWTRPMFGSGFAKISRTVPQILWNSVCFFFPLRLHGGWRRRRRAGRTEKRAYLYKPDKGR